MAQVKGTDGSGFATSKKKNTTVTNSNKTSSAYSSRTAVTTTQNKTAAAASNPRTTRQPQSSSVTSATTKTAKGFGKAADNARNRNVKTKKIAPEKKQSTFSTKTKDTSTSSTPAAKTAATTATKTAKSGFKTQKTASGGKKIRSTYGVDSATNTNDIRAETVYRQNKNEKQKQEKAITSPARYAKDAGESLGSLDSYKVEVPANLGNTQIGKFLNKYNKTIGSISSDRSAHNTTDWLGDLGRGQLSEVSDLYNEYVATREYIYQNKNLFSDYRSVLDYVDGLYGTVQSVNNSNGLVREDYRKWDSAESFENDAASNRRRNAFLNMSYSTGDTRELTTEERTAVLESWKSRAESMPASEEKRKLQEDIEWANAYLSDQEKYGAVAGRSTEEVQAMIQGWENEAERYQRHGQTDKLNALNDKITRAEAYLEDQLAADEYKTGTLDGLEQRRDAASEAYQSALQVMYDMTAGYYEQDDYDKAKAAADKAKAEYEEVNRAYLEAQQTYTSKADAEFYALSTDELKEQFKELSGHEYGEKGGGLKALKKSDELAKIQAELERREFEEAESDLSYNDDYEEKSSVDHWSEKQAQIRDPLSLQGYGSTRYIFRSSNHEYMKSFALTDEEKSNYNYQQETGGDEAAEEYYNTLSEKRLDERVSRYEQETKNLELTGQFNEEYVKELTEQGLTDLANAYVYYAQQTGYADQSAGSLVAHNILQTAGARGINITERPMAAIRQVAEGVGGALTGDYNAVNPYAAYNAAARASEQIDATVVGSAAAAVENWMNDLGASDGATKFATGAAKAVAGGVQSGLDMLIGGAIGQAFAGAAIDTLGLYKGATLAQDAEKVNTLGGNIYGFIMGSNVANSTITEAVENGHSANYALTKGLISGAIEGITEKYSIELILNRTNSMNAFRNWLKSGVAEGSEEVASNILNRCADAIIDGDEAEMRQNYYQYIRDGMTSDEALSQVIMDNLGEDAEAAAAAFISVSLFGIGKGKSSAEATQKVQTLVDLGKTYYEPGSEVYGLASQIEEKMKSANWNIQESKLEDQLVKTFTTAVRADPNTAAVVERLTGEMSTREQQDMAQTLTSMTSDLGHVVNNSAKRLLATMNTKDALQQSELIDKLYHAESLADVDAVLSGGLMLTNQNVMDEVSRVFNDLGLKGADGETLTFSKVHLRDASKARTYLRNAFDTYFNAANDVYAAVAQDADAMTQAGVEQIVAAKAERDAAVAQAGEVIEQATVDQQQNADALTESLLNGKAINFEENGKKTSVSAAEFVAEYLQENPNATVDEAASVLRNALRYNAETGPIPGVATSTRMSDADIIRTIEGAYNGKRGVEVRIGDATVRTGTDTEDKLTADKFSTGARVGGTTYAGVSVNGYVGRGYKFSAVSSETLAKPSADLKRAMRIGEALYKAFGIRVIFYEGNAMDNSGMRLLDSGASGVINGEHYMFLDVHAGTATIWGKRSHIMNTIAHELVHYFKSQNSDVYDAMYKYVKERVFHDNTAWEKAVKDVAGTAEYSSLDRAGLEEEVVAETMSSVFNKQKDLEAFLGDALENGTLDPIGGRFVNTAEKLELMFNDLFTKRDVKAISDLYGKAINAVRSSLKLFTDARDAVALDSVGVRTDADTQSAMSLKHSQRTWFSSDYAKTKDIAAKALSKSIGCSLSTAKRYIDDVNSVAKFIADNADRLDYYASPGRSSFVGNTEYGGSIDFSTICKKRRLLTGTFSAVQNALPNTALSAEEVLTLRKMMKDRGYEVSCGLCYVEGSRAKMGEYARQFLDEYAKTSPEYLPNMAEMNTPDGIEQIRVEHPDVYSAYEGFMNKLAQRKPKLYQLATEYQGEILSKFKDADNVEEKNENGGLRMQSFSDFEIIHLIDCMQAIMDMSRVGLAGQAYTKVPDFAWALGGTGLKINLSLIAKGVEDGKLILDEVEGMPRSEAEALRKHYSKNVGAIVVVFNDEQFKAAMADDFIDFIIPFHRSQWNSKMYTLLGLPSNVTDYTSKQNESYIEAVTNKNGKKLRPENYMPNTYWDFSISGKENAEKYLRMCAENNRKPKFSNLLVNNGDGSYSLQPDGSTDGYWKTLIDFKMYDNDGVGSPQVPVRPLFNMARCRRMLGEYSGGHQQFPVAEDVVKSFLKWYRSQHKGFAKSNTDAETRKAKEGELKFQRRINKLTGFISKAEQQIELSKQNKLGAASVVAFLKGHGVKAEEIKWLGLEPWLADKKSVTKEELLDFMRSNRLQLNVVTQDNREIPYTEEQQKSIAEAEEYMAAQTGYLNDRWKELFGEEGKLQSGDWEYVRQKLSEKSTAEKKATEEGKRLESAREALKQALTDEDYLGYDKLYQALRAVTFEGEAVTAMFDMQDSTKRAVREYLAAKEAYKTLETTADEAEGEFSAVSELWKNGWRQRQKAVSQHYNDNADQMANWGSSNYTTDGGTNYREILFEDPNSEYGNNAMSTHWRRRGVLIHARVDDIQADGGKMLLVEEIQSDWHNAGEKNGYYEGGDFEYATEDNSEVRLEDGFYTLYMNGERTHTAFAERFGKDATVEELAADMRDEHNLWLSRKYAETLREKAPDAPFRQSAGVGARYTDLAMKYLLREAASLGYDSIGWTSAQMQDERWKQDDRSIAPGKGKSGNLEGYTIEYDQDIPSFMKKYVKQWGSSVGTTKLDSGDTVWSVAVTPQMAQELGIEGKDQFMFQARKKNDEGLKHQLRSVSPVKPSSRLWSPGVTTEEAMRVYPDLWNVAAEESEKHNPTQITSTVRTYRKIYDILRADGFQGDILDASSGRGLGTLAGREEYGYNVDDIEPYPGADYTPRYTDYSKLDKQYDAIISNAVLNVLPQDQRDALVVKMGEMLRPGGRMFVNVRSLAEIQALQRKEKNITLGESEVAETSHGSYQKGFTKTELKAYLEDALGSGYTVTPTTKFGGVSVVVTKEAPIKFQAKKGVDAESGLPIYESNFPKGTPKKAKAARILDLIQNVWSKKPITLVVREPGKLPRKIKAKFDPSYAENVPSDASKLMGGNRHGNSSEQRVTLDLADDYYQIAEESVYNGSKNETGKSTVTHSGVKTWHYFVDDILFQEYGEEEKKPYRVTINVKERNDGSFVYSFSAEEQNNEDTARRTLHADVITPESSQADNSVLHGNKIAQDEKSVKGSGVKLKAQARNVQPLMDEIEKIRAAGSWRGKQIAAVFAEHPELDFVKRLNDKDPDAMTDLVDTLSGMNMQDLNAMIWYPVQFRTASERQSMRGAVAKYNKAVRAQMEIAKNAGKEKVGRSLGVKAGAVTTTELRDMFYALNSDAENKVIADKVFAFIDRHEGFTSDIKFKKMNTDPRDSQSFGVYVGWKIRYDTTYLNSEYYSDNHKASTILHELIHSCTSYAIWAQQSGEYADNVEITNAVDGILYVYKAIKDDPLFKGMYGIKDEYEMVAELSNPEFRVALRKKNLLTYLVDTIKNLLGIKVETSYDALNGALERLLFNYDRRYAQAYLNAASSTRSVLNLQARRGFASRKSEAEAPKFHVYDFAQGDRVTSSQSGQLGTVESVDESGGTARVSFGVGFGKSAPQTVKLGDIRHAEVGKSQLQAQLETIPDILSAESDPQKALEKLGQFVESLEKSVRQVADKETPKPLPTKKLVFRKVGEVSGAQSKKDKAEIRRLIKKYGRIQPGETDPTGQRRAVDLPNRVSDSEAVRKFMRTVAESITVPEKYVSQIERLIADKGPNGLAARYEIISDAAARHYVETQQQMYRNDPNGLLKKWNQWAETGLNDSGKPLGKNEIALGEQLIVEYANIGDVSTTMKLIGDVAAAGTQAGQVVQAMHLLKLMTPSGKLYYAQKAVDRMNRQFANRRHLGKNGSGRITIDSALAQAILKAQTQDDLDAAMDAMLQDIADQIPPNAAEIWTSWRYLSMLGNPRTHVRNFLGNALFAPAKLTKDVIAAAGEKFLKKGDRTKSFKYIFGGQLNKNDPITQYAKADFEEMKDLITGSGKHNISDEIRERRKPFGKKGAVSKFLNKYSELNSKLLDNGDVIFMKGYYVSALAGFIEARGLDINNMDERQLATARQYAIAEAQKATYRDYSAFANALSRFSRSGWAAHLITEGILPFKKTPVNILKRGVEYSPAGFIKTIVNAGRRAYLHESNPSAFIDDLASNLSGSVLFALGMLLARSGRIRRGGDDDDKTEDLMKAMGYQDFSWTFDWINGKQYNMTVDWIAPASMPFFMGVAMYDLLKTKDGLSWGDLYESLLFMASPLFSLSLLDGVNGVLESAQYAEGNNGVVSVGADVIYSYIGQGLPTLLGQVSRTIDKTRRTTYIDKNSNTPKGIQSFLQSSLFSKIPGMSFIKAPYHDVWGRKDVSGNVVLRFLENFLSPGYINEVSSSPMEEELLRLYEATGNAGVMPEKAEKSFTVNNETVNLTAEQYDRYAEAYGGTAYDLMTELVNSVVYQSAGDALRAVLAQNVYKLARDEARKALFDEYGMDSTMELASASDGSYDALDVLALYSATSNTLSGANALTADEVSVVLDKYAEPLIGLSNEEVSEWAEGKATSVIKAAYTAGTISESRAEAYLKKLRDMDADEAYFKTQEWQFKAEQGEDSDASYSKYADVFDAVYTGKSADSAIKVLTSHGYDTETVTGEVRSKIGEWFSDTASDGKTMTSGQAKSALVRYGGMTDEDAANRVTYWQYQKSNPSYADISEKRALGYVNTYSGTVPIDEYYGLCKSYAADSKKATTVDYISGMSVDSATKRSLYLYFGFAASTSPW